MDTVGTVPAEAVETHTFCVQFRGADGAYREPEMVDLFDCLTDEAKARFRQGFRFVLYGQVEALNLTPHDGEPEHAL